MVVQKGLDEVTVPKSVGNSLGQSRNMDINRDNRVHVDCSTDAVPQKSVHHEIAIIDIRPNARHSSAEVASTESLVVLDEGNRKKSASSGKPGNSKLLALLNYAITSFCTFDAVEDIPKADL